jgi:hypothetical protein
MQVTETATDLPAQMYVLQFCNPDVGLDWTSIADRTYGTWQAGVEALREVQKRMAREKRRTWRLVAVPCRPEAAWLVEIPPVAADLAQVS